MAGSQSQQLSPFALVSKESFREKEVGGTSSLVDCISTYIP